MMVIGFFTARITLSALGVENYGIYNVVGGLVGMFSLISGSLTASISRFLTFGLGKGDLVELKRIYSASLTIQLILAAIILLGTETIGLWFLNHKLVIPPERLFAANVVFQFSIISFILGLMSTPFNAMIVAHEKMTVFAFMTLFEAFAKLIIVLFLLYVDGDKLILFSALICLQGIISQAIYWIYCRNKFEECYFIVVKKSNIYKEIFHFAGWNFIGCTAALANDQGVNIMLNMFFGPLVNTGRGIGNQITSILSQFSSNFMTALNPQITKNYASNNMERTYLLIFKGTKLSYFLFLFFSIPVLLETPRVLQIWLGQIPQYAVGFARLAIVLSLVNLLSNALINAQLATGKLKTYQIVVGGVLLFNLPISYLFLRLGFPATVTMVVAILISQICMFLRLWFLRRMMGLPIKRFIKEVYFKVAIVTILAMLPPSLEYYLMPVTLGRFFIVALTGITTTAVLAYTIGCDTGEKALIKSAVHKLSAKLFIA